MKKKIIEYIKDFILDTKYIEFSETEITKLENLGFKTRSKYAYATEPYFYISISDIIDKIVVEKYGRELIGVNSFEFRKFVVTVYKSNKKVIVKNFRGLDFYDMFNYIEKSIPSVDKESDKYNL